MDLSNFSKARIPLNWALALLAGCATFTTAAFTAGSYFGSRDANATSVEQRVATVEVEIKGIRDLLPEMAAGIARLEGAMGTLPQGKRVPAGE